MGNYSRLFLVLASLGASLGLGSIFIYPYLSFNLTSAFLIQFIVALLLAGVPLIMLETSIGQYFDKNIVDLFASIKKWLSSVGWLMFFNSLIVMSFYAVLVSWSIIYVFVSFGMQWKSNPNEYFLNNVIQASEGIGKFTQFSLPVFIALIIAWVIVFLFIRKGFESLKKCFLITLPALAFLMLFFLFYSLNLDNALNGIYDFMKPDFRILLDLGAWANAFLLAIISLGLAFGAMHAFGRKSGHGFIFGNASIVAIFELLFSIAFALIVFGILGFLSMKTEASSVISSDFIFPFTILAQALPFFYKPTLLSILFFVFIGLFFILGTASLAYSISHVLVHKFSTKHINAAIIVSGFGFLLSLLFAVKPGIYIMDIVMHFVYYNILIAILLEALAIGWFFDCGKISGYINNTSVIKIGALWKFVVRYFIPLIAIWLIFVQLKSDLSLNYNNYAWYHLLLFGVGTVIVPLVISFLMPQKLLDKRK